MLRLAPKTDSCEKQLYCIVFTYLISMIQSLHIWLDIIEDISTIGFCRSMLLAVALILKRQISFPPNAASVTDDLFFRGPQILLVSLYLL